MAYCLFCGAIVELEHGVVSFFGQHGLIECDECGERYRVRVNIESGDYSGAADPGP